ncbi:MAG: OmpA family protein [Desulfobacteraceae bacterium]|nr:OmpA family protein [Desulfobacteraceae bacterium]
MGAPVEEKPDIEPGAPKWVVTFGDLMSLLLCFFVLLLSFSELDRQKYKQVAGSMEKAFGVQKRTKIMEIPKGMKMIAKDFDQEIIATRIREEIGRQVEELFASKLEGMEGKIEIKEGAQEVVIRLMGESTFDSGKAEIKVVLKPLLKEVAELLESSDEDVIISGHTDNIRMRGGPFKTNLRLSAARASAVAEFLIANSSIDPQRISTMGFGKYRPIASNSTAEGREKNRRVEIIIGNLPRRTQ